MEKIMESGTREKILAAARAEFAEHGLEGARVDRIAARAGANKAMIYYHYHSKENLYNEVISSHFREVMSKIRRNAGQMGSLEQCLGAIADAHIEIALSAPEFISVMLRELANPRDEVLDKIAEVLLTSGLPAILERKIEAGVAQGELRPVDIPQAIVTFMTMSLGYRLLAPIVDRVWNVTDRERFAQERKKTMIDIFMNGLKAR
jgi:AcrR family transcriptional regulator